MSSRTPARTPALARVAVAAPGVAVALMAALLLGGCAPGDPGGGGEPSTPATTASVSPDESDEPAPDETTDAPTDAATLTDDQRVDLAEGVMAKLPAVVLPYLDDTVEYIIASSECCGATSAADAVDYLMSDIRGANNWANIDASVIEGVRASQYYGRYLSDDVIGLRGDDETAVLLVLNGTRVTAILIGTEEILQW